MVIYLASIAVVTLALGALLDGIYRASNTDPSAVIGQARMLPAWVTWPSAAVFAALLFFSFRRVRPPSELRSLSDGLHRLLGFRVTGRGLVRVAVALLAAWVVTLCFVAVPPGYRALVTTFGAPSGEPRGPGLHLKWPPPIGRAELVSAAGVRRLEIGFRSGDEGTAAPGVAEDLRTLEEESLFVTGDENLVSTRCAVQYRVSDPELWQWDHGSPEEVLKLAAISELLEVLAAYPIDAVYTEDRREVEQLVLENLVRRAPALGLGVELVGFRIRDVHAPPEVHAAFRDVASAQEDKETAINVALRYRDETVNLARGEAARQRQIALSDSTANVELAQGDGESLVLRSKAYRERPVGTFTRLYLETAEEILSRGRKIIRPGWEGSGGVDLWITNGRGMPVPAADVLRGGDVRRAQRGEE
jgi:membrane protease subunit HflK